MNNHHENCHVESVEKPLDDHALEAATAVYLQVSGMGCERCAIRVRNGLLALDGVLLADVFLEHGVAAVALDRERVTAAQLVDAVVASGNDGRHRYRGQLISEKPVSDALERRGEYRSWR